MTQKCHYIPCLWSAFWNLQYHNNPAYRANEKARRQVIYSLNISGNKILKTKVENVFYEKKMNLDSIDNSIMIDFIRRNMPHEESDFRRQITDDLKQSILDFEGYFTAIDNSIVEPITEIIISKSIDNIAQKTEVAYLIATSLIRNFRNINSLTKIYSNNNMPKFELFWHLQNILSDPKGVMEVVFPFVSSKWILHKSKDALIPLCDQPILQREKDILFTLSPYLLLQIFLQTKVLPDEICEIKENIDFNLHNEFMQVIAETAEREIISPNLEFLNKIKKSIAYKTKN